LGAHDAARAPRADRHWEYRGFDAVGSTAEGADTLENLSGILLFKQVDGQEHVVLLQIERRRLAGTEEMRYVLHLDKGHRRLLELDTGWSDGEVDEPGTVLD
jgi:hypothetical protein